MHPRLLFPLAAALLAALVLVPAAGAAGGTADDSSAAPLTLAVIGDTPYGNAQIARFPSDIAQINDDPKVRLVVHLGDIKNGSSRCDDSYFQLIRSDFDLFKDPFVYTPGDNEWTDCHRTNNGGYVPTERLAALRSVFFDRPGYTLGQRPKVVDAQSAPLVENVRWRQSRVVFATLHVVGSNDDLAPWFGAPQPSTAQLLEHETRQAAAVRWLDDAFDAAEAADAAGVVIGMQADMWDPFAIAAGQTSGFDAVVAKLAERAQAFGRPVLLLEGDSHQYLVDRPLANGSPAHHVTTAAPNVTRIVVQGSTSVPHEWLRLTVDPSTPSVFSWENVVFAP